MDWALLLAVTLPLVAGLGLMGLAIFVYRVGRAHRHNQVFAALYLLSGIKSIGDGLQQVADGFNDSSPLFPDSVTWIRFGLLCAFWMVPLLIYFILIFPRPVAWIKGRQWMAGFLFAPSVGLSALLLLTPHAASDPVPAQLGSTFLAFNVASTLVTVVAVAYLLRLKARLDSDVERKQAFYLVLGWLPAFVATWFITSLLLIGRFAPTTFSGTTWGTLQVVVNNIIWYYSPVLELMAAGFVAYAILKYSILGIELKVKFGVKSLVFGLMVGSIFFVTQFIENVILQGQLFAFAGDYGSFILSGVSSILLFKPIEKVSNKAANKLFPDTGSAAYVLSRSEEIYEAQVMYVLRDGAITDRERSFLANLREQLSVDAVRARDIEEVVERRLKTDLADTGHSAQAAPEPEGAALPSDGAGTLPDGDAASTGKPPA